MKILSNQNIPPKFREFEKELTGMWGTRPEYLADDITDLANNMWWEDMKDVYGEMEGNDLVLYLYDYDSNYWEFRCNIENVGEGTYCVKNVTDPIISR